MMGWCRRIVGVVRWIAVLTALCPFVDASVRVFGQDVPAESTAPLKERDRLREQRLVDADGGAQTGFVRVCRDNSGDHQRSHGKRSSGQRLLLSDHGHQLAYELWSDGLAGGAGSQQRDWIDLRHTHSSGNLHGDSERN